MAFLLVRSTPATSSLVSNTGRLAWSVTSFRVALFLRTSFIRLLLRYQRNHDVAAGQVFESAQSHGIREDDFCSVWYRFRGVHRYTRHAVHWLRNRDAVSHSPHTFERFPIRLTCINNQCVHVPQTGRTTLDCVRPCN